MKRFLAFSLILISVLLTALAPAAMLIPVTGSASNELPTPQQFAQQVLGEDQNSITGLYLSGVAALPVLQQPSNNAGFVSEEPDKVTQFGMASQYGSTGILAHNYLAGQYFFQLQPNQIILLTYGDGSVAYYRISQVLQYQAISPFDPYTNFVDLQTNETVDVVSVFNTVYAHEDRLVLQTCIDANGNSSWGRLFVIAEPYEMDFTAHFEHLINGSARLFTASAPVASN